MERRPDAGRWWEVLEFDYLLVATGAGFRGLVKGDEVLDLDDFTANRAPNF